MRVGSRRRYSIFLVMPSPCNASAPMNQLLKKSDGMQPHAAQYSQKSGKDTLKSNSISMSGDSHVEIYSVPLGIKCKMCKNGPVRRTRHIAPCAKFDTRCSTTATGTSRRAGRRIELVSFTKVGLPCLWGRDEPLHRLFVVFASAWRTHHQEGPCMNWRLGNQTIRRGKA